MNPDLNTVFVFGAGFSMEQGYPLASTMRERVFSFLESEKNPFSEFLKPWNGELPEGQFYTGLREIEGDVELPFEELLIKFAEAEPQEQGEPGCWQLTYNELRKGVRYVLWDIHKQIECVKPAYRNFATWLRPNWHRHGIISFNWDLQAELLLHQHGVPWHYCPNAQGSLPVIKPHGSINWNKHRKEGYDAEYPHWCSVGYTNLSFDAKAPLSDPELDAIVPHLSYTLFPGDPDLPNSDEDVGLLWKDAERLIQNADEVVFIGYSFPDYDKYACEFFRQWVQDKKVIAINPSDDDLKQCETILDTDIEPRKERFSDCSYAQPSTDN